MNDVRVGDVVFVVEMWSLKCNYGESTTSWALDCRCVMEIVDNVVEAWWMKWMQFCGASITPPHLRRCP